MSTKILIDQRVYSNLVKCIIDTRKLLLDLSNRTEFNKEWLSISEIESVFGLSRKMIDGYRKRGLKINQKNPNGKILIRRSDLEKFIQKK